MIDKNEYWTTLNIMCFSDCVNSNLYVVTSLLVTLYLVNYNKIYRLAIGSEL